MISQETIDRINQVADIIQVISKFIKLKRTGDNHVGRCPFHNEKTGSFTVSAGKKIYKCFGCGKSGDVIQFLIEHEKKSYPEAVQWLCQQYNVPFEMKERKYVKPEPRLEKLGAKAISWFEKERRISNNTLLRLGITEAVEWMPQFNKEIKVICYNYYRNGELVNIKFRGPKKSFKLAKDAELVFYNIDAIENENEVIIVEGENDLLATYESHIYNVVSVPNGAGVGNLKLEYLDNCWEAFEGKTKIILAVDNDEPGKALREELGRRLGKERCYWVDYPEGCKDLNEVLIKHSGSVIAHTIENAREWPLEGIISMEDMYPTIEEYYKNGYPRGAKTGIRGLDHLLTFAPGQLTMVTGIPSHGKDEFTNWIMAMLSMNEEWSWAICGFEEPATVQSTKIMEKLVGKAFDYRMNPDFRMNPADKDFGIYMVDKYFTFIDMQQIDANIDSILKWAEVLVKRKGIKGLIINPWNCLEHKIPPGSTETIYVSEVLTKLTNFLVRNGVHGFLVAHPTKMMKNPKTGKYEVPTLYSISGSSNFYNKTHNGMCVYRDFETNVVDVYIQKVKWSWMGKVGFSTYSYDTMTRQYNFLSSSINPD
jgi:twinkle protein